MPGGVISFVAEFSAVAVKSIVSGRITRTVTGVGTFVGRGSQHTGIAGPGGGSLEKPVGLVHMAVADHSGMVSEHCIFGGNRAAIKQQAANYVLTMLRDYLIQQGA